MAINGMFDKAFDNGKVKAAVNGAYRGVMDAVRYPAEIANAASQKLGFRNSDQAADAHAKIEEFSNAPFFAHQSTRDAMNAASNENPRTTMAANVAVNGLMPLAALKPASALPSLAKGTPSYLKPSVAEQYLGAGVKGISTGVGGQAVTEPADKYLAPQRTPDQHINQGIQGALQGQQSASPLGNRDPYQIGQVNNALIPDKASRVTNMTGRPMIPISGNAAQDGVDYDYDGYVSKYGNPHKEKGEHYTDEFKLPSHITFSNQSKYHDDNMSGGTWRAGGADKFIFTPSQFNLKQYSPDDYAQYFNQSERQGTFVQLPDGRLIEGTQ